MPVSFSENNWFAVCVFMPGKSSDSSLLLLRTCPYDYRSSAHWAKIAIYSLISMYMCQGSSLRMLFSPRCKVLVGHFLVPAESWEPEEFKTVLPCLNSCFQAQDISLWMLMSGFFLGHPVAKFYFCRLFCGNPLTETSLCQNCRPTFDYRKQQEYFQKVPLIFSNRQPKLGH